MKQIEIVVASESLAIVMHPDDPVVLSVLHSIASTLDRLHRADDAKAIRKLIRSLEKH